MEEKKEKAIQIARDYFHRYGYRKLSLAQLIDEVGISKPTFYNYFKNKKELFRTVMLETYNEFQYQLNQNMKSTTSAVDKLDVFIETYHWFLKQFPIFSDLYKPGNDLITRWLDSRYSKDLFYEGKETVASIIEEGQEEGLFNPELNVQEVAPVLFSAIILTLSHDINNYKRKKDHEYTCNPKTLAQVLIEGLLVRD